MSSTCCSKSGACAPGNANASNDACNLGDVRRPVGSKGAGITTPSRTTTLLASILPAQAFRQRPREVPPPDAVRCARCRDRYDPDTTRFDGTEGLDHLSRRVVAQQHGGRADANGVGGGRDQPDKHCWRRRRNTNEVVFGDPVTLVSPRASAERARSSEFRKAWRAVPPSLIGERSSTDSGALTSVRFRSGCPVSSRRLPPRTPGGSRQGPPGTSRNR